MNNQTEKTIAEEKAVAIIVSCKTTQQFETARVYLDLFNNKFQDTASYTKLWKLWKTTVAS